MSDGLTLDEMSGNADKAPKLNERDIAGEFLSLADMDPKAVAKPPEPKPGALANDPDDSSYKTAAKYGATALIRGLSQVPGIFGNLSDAADTMFAGVAAVPDTMLDNKNYSQALQEQLAKVKAGKEMLNTLNEQSGIPRFADPSNFMPSGHDISGAVTKMTGEYVPQTAGGRIGMAAAEGLGASVAPGAFMGKMNAAPYVANLISGTAGGAGTQTAAEVTDNPFAQMGAGLLASVLPGVSARMAMGRTKGTAERLAGQTLRDATADPDAAIAASENIPPPLPGMNLTTAQTTRDPGMQALTDAMRQKTAKEGTFGSQIDESTARAKDILKNTGEDAANAVAPGAGTPGRAWTVSNLGANSTDEISTRARDIFTHAEEGADQAQAAAWNVPQLEKAQMFKNKTVTKIRDAIDNMTVADRAALPDKLGGQLDELEARYGNNVPMKEIQSLHSNLLADQRAAVHASSPNPNLARVTGKIADEVKGILFDKGNYFQLQGGDATLNAFANAKKATAEYYKTFGPLKDLLAEPAAGVNKVAPEATLGRVLRGENAPQNVRLFQRATGGAANDFLSDHVVSDLTDHGMTLPQPDKIEKYLTQNASVVDSIPGLRDRLTSLRGASRADLVAQGITDNLDRPERLLTFLDNNAQEVGRVFKTPQQKELVAGIKDGARRLSAIPAGEIGTKDTFNKVSNGRLLDVLLGTTAAKALGVGAGVGTAHILQEAAGPAAAHLGDLVEMLGGAMGAAMHGTKSDIPGRIATDLVMGDNQERIMELLQKGLRDPKTAAFLMQKADPKNIPALLQQVQPNLAGTLPVVGEQQKYAKGGRVSPLRRSQHLIAKINSTFPLAF